MACDNVRLFLMGTIEARILARKSLRQSWKDEEQRSICAQARMPNVSVAQVARCYSMNANLIVDWLSDPRFEPEQSEVDEPVFLPVEVSGNKNLSGPESYKQPRLYYPAAIRTRWATISRS